MRYSSFSLRLAEIMGERKLTQDVLAHKLGISQTSVSRWLAGAAPRKPTAALLANLLGVSVDWLLTGEGIKSINNPIDSKRDFEATTPKSILPPAELNRFLAGNEAAAPILKTIGERLRWIRESRNMTLSVFAQFCDCDTSYISKLESGVKTNPSPEFIQKVMQRFYVRESWILSGNGHPFNHEPDFYDVNKLKPAEVALWAYRNPHYSLLSDELLFMTLDEMARYLHTVPKDLDELGFIVDIIAGIATELGKRSRDSTLSISVKRNNLPKIETRDSSFLAERVQMIQNGSETSIHVLPNELEECVKRGVKVVQILTYKWNHETQRYVSAALNMDQTTVLMAWQIYWQNKRDGKNPEEPPHLNVDGSVPDGALDAFFKPKQIQSKNAPLGPVQTEEESIKPSDITETLFKDFIALRESKIDPVGKDQEIKTEQPNNKSE